MIRSILTVGAMALPLIVSPFMPAQYDPYPTRHCEAGFHLQRYPIEDCVLDGYEQRGRATYFVWTGQTPERPAEPASNPPVWQATALGNAPPAPRQTSLADASRHLRAATRLAEVAARNGRGIPAAIAELDQARRALVLAETRE